MEHSWGVGVSSLSLGASEISAMMLQWLSTGMTWWLSSNVKSSSGVSRQASAGAFNQNTHTRPLCVLGPLLVWESDSGVRGQTFQENQVKLRGFCLPIFGFHTASLQPRPVLTRQLRFKARDDFSPSLHRRLARSCCITTRGNEITRCDLPSKFQPATSRNKMMVSSNPADSL